MKIIQIDTLNVADEVIIHGLGDDGILYIWNTEAREWQKV